MTNQPRPGPTPSDGYHLRHFEAGRPTPWVSDGQDVRHAPLPADRPLPLLPDLYVPAPAAPAAAVPSTRTVGWYRNVTDPTWYRYWDGQQWIEPSSAAPPQPTMPAEQRSSPLRRDRRHRPRSAVTVTQALAMVLAIVAVVTFALVSTLPGRSAARSESTVPPATVPRAPSPSTPSTPSTTVAGAGQLSPDAQVVQWWTSTGSPTTSSLAADLETMQGHRGDVVTLSTDCSSFAPDAQSAASAPPAPLPTIQREWQLVISTTQRVAGVCAAQRYTSASTDVQPALYTIRDLTHQITPYLAGHGP